MSSVGKIKNVLIKIPLVVVVIADGGGVSKRKTNEKKNFTRGLRDIVCLLGLFW